MNRRKKAGLLTAAVIVSLTMLSNTAEAATMEVTTGDYKITGGKIYYNNQERSAFYGAYLSSEEEVKIPETKWWRLPAGGGTVQYKNWNPPYEDEDHHIVPGHWDENWHDSTYNHAFIDREGNLVAESINYPGSFEVFSTALSGDYQDGHASYGSNHNVMWLGNTGATNLGVPGDSLLVYSTIENEVLTPKQSYGDYTGLVLSTSSPIGHKTNGEWDASSGPYTIRLYDSNFNGNVINGGVPLLVVSQGYSHTDYDTDPYTHYNLPTEVYIADTNIKSNEQTLTSQYSMGGGLLSTSGNYPTDDNPNVEIDTLYISGLNFKDNTVNASDYSGGVGMSSLADFGGYTEIKDSNFEFNTFETVDVKHSGGTIHINGVALGLSKGTKADNIELYGNSAVIEGESSGEQQDFQARGIGIYASGLVHTIKNSIINYNKVEVLKNGSGSIYGVGIYNDGSQFNLENSEVKYNTAELYDGSYNDIYGVGISTGGIFQATDSSIHDNEVKVSGYLHDTTSTNIRGVGIHSTGLYAYLDDTSVYNNKAEYSTLAYDYIDGIDMQGGGIYSSYATLGLGNVPSKDMKISDNILEINNLVKVRSEHLAGGGIWQEWGNTVISGAESNPIEIRRNKLTAGGTLHSKDGADLDLTGGGIFVRGDDFSKNDLTITNVKINNNELYGFLKDDGTTVGAYDHRTESDIRGGGLYNYNANSKLENIEIVGNKLTTEVSLTDSASFGTLRALGAGAYLAGGEGGMGALYMGDTINNANIFANVIDFRLTSSNQADNVGFNYRSINIGGAGLFTQSNGQFQLIGTSADTVMISNNQILYNNFSDKKYDSVYLVGAGVDALSGGTYQKGNQSFVFNNVDVGHNEIKAYSFLNAPSTSWMDKGDINAYGGGIALDGNDDAQGAILDPTFNNTNVYNNLISVSAVDDTVYARGGGMYLYMPGYNQDGTPFDRTLTLNNVDVRENRILVSTNDGAYASGGGIYINTHYGNEKVINITGAIDSDDIKTTYITNNVASASATAKNSSAEAYGGGLFMYNDDGNVGKDYDRSLNISDLAEISGNSAIADALYEKARANAYGGGLYIQRVANDNPTTLFDLRNSGAVKGNTAIAAAQTTPIHHQGSDEYGSWDYWESFSNAYGGGIYLTNSFAEIYDTDIKNNSAESMVGNNETDFSYGGGIYSENSEIHIRGTGSEENSNNLQISGNSAKYGGGLYLYKDPYSDRKSVALIKNTDFKNNSAKQGGGIYAENSTVELKNTRDGKPMVFSGNTAAKGSDVYLNHSELNLYAGSDNTTNAIVFNGTIAGDADSTINQYKRDGYVALSGDGNQFEGTYNLHLGKLGFTNNDNKATNYHFAKFGAGHGTLDLQNKMADKTYTKDVVTIDTLSAVDVNDFYKGIDLKVDFDASDPTSMDKVTVVNVADGILPGIYLANINVTKDGSAATAVYLDGAARNHVIVRDDVIKSATTNYVYTFTPDKDVNGDLRTHGLLHVTRNELDPVTLAEAIADKTYSSYSFTNSGDYVTSTDLGDLAYKDDNTRSFTIYGNGHDLNGNQKDGVQLGDDQILTLDNVTTVKNFAGAAIKNTFSGDEEATKGVVNVISSSFSGNDADILNNAIVNLQSGTINFASGIQDIAGSGDLGTTNINGAIVILGDDATIKQANLNINSGSLTSKASALISNITNGAKLILTGGNLASAISGTGTTEIAGAVTNTGDKAIANAVTVRENASLSTSATNLGAAVTNSGTVNLTGGTLSNAITGGTITISGDTTSSANNLIGSITNAESTLTLAGGTLSQAISGNGTTKVSESLALVNGASVAGTLNVNAGLLDLATDDVALTYNIGTLTGTTGTLKLDVDLTGNTPVSDAINLATANNSIALTINDIAVNGTLGNFTVDVLKGQTTGATISLAQAVSDQFNYTGEWEDKQSSDTLTQTATWDDTFSSRTWQERTVKEIGVANNTKISYTETVEKQNEQIETGDTIALLTQATQFGTGERKYTTNDANKAHMTTADFGEMAAGTLTIQGAQDGNKRSTIYMFDKKGFTVGEGATLNLDTVAFQMLTSDEEGALINNTAGTVNINNVDSAISINDAIKNDATMNVTDSIIRTSINGNGTTNLYGSNLMNKLSQGDVNLDESASLTVKYLTTAEGVANDGYLLISDDTGSGIIKNLDSDITGNGQTVFDGVVLAAGDISQSVVQVTDDSTLTHTGDITVNERLTNMGTITLNSEESTLNLNGGTSEEPMAVYGTINGTGNIVVNGIVDSTATISNAVEVASTGSLKTNADKVTGTLTNNGQTELTGGNIQNTISGNGTTQITGGVTNMANQTVTQQAIEIASGASLTSAADKINAAITNDGTYTMAGGTNANNITGSGTTTIYGGAVTNTADIETAVTVSSGASLESNADNIKNTVANNGTYTVTGGTVANDITGTGGTKVSGDVVNNASIANVTDVISGSLDNTNGTLNDVIITSGSLKSNADKVGTVVNNGSYEVTGGTITNAMSGTGDITIAGDVVNNAVNTVTGMVTVADGAQLTASASGDTFTSASTLNMANGSTLSIQDGSATAAAVNNLLVAAGDTVNLKMDWKDTFNSTSANINGNISITDINLANTDGSDDSYLFSNLGEKIAIAPNVNLSGVTDTTSNFAKYDSSTGNMLSYRNNLVKAVDNTEEGEVATYVMTGDETAGGHELDGTLKVQGNGNSITPKGIVVGSSTTQNADLILEDVNLKNITGDALKVNGGNKAHIVANNYDVDITGVSGNAVTLTANGTNYAEVDFDAGSKTITIDNDIISDNANNKVEFKSGDIQFNGKFDPAMGVVSGATVTRSGADVGIDWTLTSGTLLYTNDSFLNNSTNSVTFNGGDLDTRNGAVTTFGLKNITLNPGTTSNFYADVDLAAGTMDNFGSTPVTSSATASVGTLNVAGLNLISDATTDNTTINFTTDSTLMAAVNYTGGQGLTALSPIYKYNVAYDNTNGNFDFTRFATGGYGDYNPSIMAAPVAAQLGGYAAQLNSYDEAFRNMDMYMLMTKDQRQAMKMRNKYASDDTKLAYDSSTEPIERTAGWFKPFASWETVNLKKGPHVENTLYGSYFGLESGVKELSNGWDGNWGVYAGYNGSHQHYDGVGIYQNGGTLGLNGMLYKGDFFTGLTANVGSNVADASTMYGHEDFVMLMTGIASKTGYNWELADGKFIIQPSYLMSYTMVNTFDYTNAAGVRVNSDPLHAIQLEPGIKLIGNLANGWQPYLGASIVWNILDKTHFEANDVSLPNLSIKPFGKYNVGVQKTWGDRFTGYAQVYATSGGRNGIGVQGGFRWAIGKDPSNGSTKKTSSMPQKKETKISLNNIK